MMTEQVAYEHREDLRREAAAYRAGARGAAGRAASRQHRAAPRLTSRVAVTLHLRSGAVGCQA